MIREITKIDIGLIVEIGEHHKEDEVNLDKVIEEDNISLIITEITLDETILERHEITEGKIIEVDTEGIIEMIILEEVGVGLRIDNIQIILEGMIEAVVGLDQVQELPPKEIELDAIRVENMIIMLRTIQLHKQKESEQIQIYNMDEEQAILKMLATATYDSLNRINLIDETIGDYLNF